MPSNHLILCRPLLLPSIFSSIRVFSMSQLFTSGGQSIGASASGSVLPRNNQDWFPLWLTGLNILNIPWKDWSWSTNTLATWCKELTHSKRPWCWERLKAGGEGDNRGWDGWMASPTQCTWVWASSGRWWRTGKPGMLQFMGSQRVRHDWTTTDFKYNNVDMLIPSPPLRKVK